MLIWDQIIYAKAFGSIAKNNIECLFSNATFFIASFSTIAVFSRCSFRLWLVIKQDLVVPSVMNKGIEFSSSTMSMMPGIPIKPMLAKYIFYFIYLFMLLLAQTCMECIFFSIYFLFFFLVVESQMVFLKHWSSFKIRLLLVNTSKSIFLSASFLLTFCLSALHNLFKFLWFIS